MSSKDAPLSGKLVAVLGGSGFIGTHVAQELLSLGARLRIASRHPERAYSLKPLANLGQIQFVGTDITKIETVERAMQGADMVVNLVGAFDGDLAAVQGSGLEDVAAKAKEMGVSAFVQTSAIGADASSPTGYGKSKAEGEEAVRRAFREATIIRPSILFGPDDNFINMFAGLIATFPALPIFAPDAPLQPVHVDDIAEAVGAILTGGKAHHGKTYELAGPEVLTMLEINQRIAKAQGRQRKFIKLPDSISKAFAMLPGTPMSTDQFTLLKQGNVASGDYPGFAELGIAPKPLGLFLDRWMVRYRRNGRFTEGTAA